jgi:hypothetical protein
MSGQLKKLVGGQVLVIASLDSPYLTKTTRVVSITMRRNYVRKVNHFTR